MSSIELHGGEATGKRLAVLALAALGVVYSDIGTSPLYAMKECFALSDGNRLFIPIPATTACRSVGQPYDLAKQDGVYCLKLKIPFASKGDLELNKVSDELIVRIGSFKKHILLPRHVAASKSVKARMEEEYLNVCFEGEDHG